jgi:hypothetical protein
MGGPVMDLLDRAEDHRRSALDRPAHQVPWAVAVLYLGEPLFDRHEFAVRAGGHVTASQNGGQRVWRGIELQAQDVGKSAFVGFDDGAGVMGDQPAQHGVGVLGIAKVPGAVQGVQARHGRARSRCRAATRRLPGGRRRRRELVPGCVPARPRPGRASSGGGGVPGGVPGRDVRPVKPARSCGPRLGSRGGTFTDLACRLKTSSDASARSSAMHVGLSEAASAASVIPRGSGGSTEIKKEIIARSLGLVVIGFRMCSCCRGERPDPGRDIDCRAAARGSTTISGCGGWHRASRGPLAAVP